VHVESATRSVIGSPVEFEKAHAAIIVRHKSRGALLSPTASRPDAMPVATHRMGRTKSGHAKLSESRSAGHRLGSWSGPPWGQSIIEEKRRQGIMIFMEMTERIFLALAVITPILPKKTPIAAIVSTWSTDATALERIFIVGV